jgi:putative ABC transport system permease protein
MADPIQATRFRFWRWLIRFIGVIVPQRFRARFKQEWEAELEYRQELLTRWDRLNWRTKLLLLWRSLGAFWDALWLQQLRLEDEMIQDLRFGVRMLRSQPVNTLIAIFTLALGIGANTAIFSVVNEVLLNPVPNYDPQRLVWVTEVHNGNDLRSAFTNNYVNWQKQSRSFEHLSAFNFERIIWTGRGDPERLESFSLTANAFPSLGVVPQLGRAFTPEEEQPAAAGVVLLGHAFWQRRFGGDQAIIGQALTLGGQSRTVIGVMPPDFRDLFGGKGRSEAVDVWLPLSINGKGALNGEVTNIGVFGRLKRGFSVEQAGAELNQILQRIDQANPDRLRTGVRVMLVSEMLVGHLRLGLLVLFGAVGLVLLIACANVANLLLGRAATRRKELAVRAALGARRGRLVRQLLTESLLLSILGGMAGLLLAVLGVKALVALTPDTLAPIRASSVDGTVMGFNFLAALLTGVAAGLIPALQTSQIDLNEALKEGARKAATLRRRGLGRVSPVLVIGELALTLVLLAGSGLLIKSYINIIAIEPGYDLEKLLTLRIPLDQAKYPPGSPQEKAFYREILTRVKALPGVQSVATGTGIPLTGWSGTRLLSIEGRPPVPDAPLPEVQYSEVSPDYFHTLGIKLRAGRTFTEQDDMKAPRVVIINEILARRYFSGEDPIGKRIFPSIPHTIVGVVSDVKRFGLEAEVLPEIYCPYTQTAMENGVIFLVARTAGDPLDLVSAVRQQIYALEVKEPIFNVMTMEQALERSIAPRRFQMLLFGIFAAVALVLAVVGVYGVISYSVSRRTHEIGIRMALGARPRNVLWMVVRQGMTLVFLGVAIGLAATVALTNVLESLLFELSATDPATIAVIASLLIGVALLACYLPARRAMKVDPMTALRSE